MMPPPDDRAEAIDAETVDQLLRDLDTGDDKVDDTITVLDESDVLAIEAAIKDA